MHPRVSNEGFEQDINVKDHINRQGKNIKHPEVRVRDRRADNGERSGVGMCG